MPRKGVYMSLDDLKQSVQDSGIKSASEYRSRYKEIRNAPSNPDKVYEEWRGWADLCGYVFYHGESKTPEYSSWSSMMRRCYDAHATGYERYGGATPPVRVCARWHDYRKFLDDMGRRPDGTSLGRFRDAGNYEPGNSSWQTPKEQGAEFRARRGNKCNCGHDFTAGNMCYSNGKRYCRLCAAVRKKAA